VTAEAPTTVQLAAFGGQLFCMRCRFRGGETETIQPMRRGHRMDLIAGAMWHLQAHITDGDTIPADAYRTVRAQRDLETA
jgi:hypothetical protein